MKTLRFSTTKPMGMMGIFNSKEDHKPLATPTDIGEIIEDKTKGTGAYIHGDAEELAGFDIPSWIDGNLCQLDLPVEEQDIVMILPEGEFKCKAVLQTDKFGDYNKYYLTLKK
ncbi:MAG: hypothetical protein RLZZ546_1141 [Bacteroidota bacterium]|jgi:hypothetical protein